MGKVLTREEVARLQKALFTHGAMVVHKRPGKHAYMETLKSFLTGREAFIKNAIWKEKRNGLDHPRPTDRRDRSGAASPTAQKA